MKPIKIDSFLKSVDPLEVSCTFTTYLLLVCKLAVCLQVINLFIIRAGLQVNCLFTFKLTVLFVMIFFPQLIADLTPFLNLKVKESFIRGRQGYLEVASSTINTKMMEGRVFRGQTKKKIGLSNFKMYLLLSDLTSEGI